MRSRIIARNSFLTGIDAVVGYAMTVLITVLVARVLGPSRLGYYAYVMWVTHIAGMFVSFGVPVVMRKYVAEMLGRGDIAAVRAIVRLATRIQLAISITTTAIGLAVVFIKVPSEHQGYAVLAVLSLLPSMLLAIPSAINQAYEDFLANVWPSIVSMTVNLLGVLAVLSTGGGLVGLTASLLISRLLDCSLRYYYFRRNYGQRFAAAEACPSSSAIVPELRRRMMRFYCHSTILLGINVVVWDRSELLFLKHFCDIRQVAFYSLSFGVMRTLAYLPQAFTWAAGANLMVQQGRDASRLGPIMTTAVRFLVLITLPLTLGMFALSSPAVRVVYGSQYAPAIPVLALMALFSVPVSLVPVARELLVASDNLGFLVKWGVITAVLNLGLDYWWIPKGGALGAAMANGVAQLIAALGIWVFCVRRFAIRFAWSSMVKTAVSAAVMAVVVGGLARLLPSLAALVFGVPLGAVVFFLSLRWMRGLDPADQQRLLSVETQLPRPLRRFYATSVRLLLKDLAFAYQSGCADAK